MNKLNIVGICGSLRKGSYNKIVLENIKEKFSDKINLEILDISKVPFFNEDIDVNTLESVNILKDKIDKAEAVVIATPEYNYSVPGVLKNTIDWLSRGEIKPFDNKKVAIVSSSLGFLGGARVQYHLREVLLCLNADVIKKPEVFIGDVHKKVNDKGEIIDEMTIKILGELIEQI